MKFPHVEYDHKLSSLFVISILYPLGPAALILMPMIVGGVVDGYGFSEQEAASIASMEGMGLVIASVLAAFWVRKVSWSNALFLSLILTAILNIVSANMTEVTQLAITRFLAGFTGGSVFAVTVAALGDNREPDKAFGIGQGVQGIMMLLGFVSAPYLIADMGVGGIFYALAAACVLMLLCLFHFPSVGDVRGEADQGATPHHAHTVLIWLGLIASVIFFINIFGFWAFLERIGQSRGIPAETVGLALGIAQIAAIGGGLLAAILSDRFGRALPLLLVVVGQSWALWALLGEFTSITFFIGASVFQALFVLGVSYQMGIVAMMDIKGKFLVLMTAAQGLGGAIGPGIAGSLITEGGDYSSINFMAVLCCAISTAIFLFVVFRTRHEVKKAAGSLQAA